MKSCISAKTAAAGTAYTNVDGALKKSIKVIGDFEARFSFKAGLKSLYKRIPDFDLIISE